MSKEQPPVVIVKQERPPGILEWGCACGCGIPVIIFIIGAIIAGIQGALGL